MKYTRNDMPIVDCPNCEQEFEWDDYYNVAAGNTRECEHCGTELEVLSVDITVECRIGIKECTPAGKPEVQK